jgi:hypothetical protein
VHQEEDMMLVSDTSSSDDEEHICRPDETSHLKNINN